MSDPQHFGLGELGQRVQAMSDPAATPANGPAPAAPTDPRLRPYQGAPLPIGSFSGRGPLNQTLPAPGASPNAGPNTHYEPREDLRTPPSPAPPVPLAAASQFGLNTGPAPYSPPSPSAAIRPLGQSQPRPFDPGPEPNFAPNSAASFASNFGSNPPAPPASAWDQVAVSAQPEQQSSSANPAEAATPPSDAPSPAASQPPSQTSTTQTTEMPKSGFQRAMDAVRSAIPIVQRLLPLLDGNFATAMGALMAPQNHPAPPPVQVDLEPVERGLAEVRNSNRELRTQVVEQGASLKRVEDQLDRVREATDRNTLEQQELVEDLRAVGNRVSTFAIVGVILLLISLGLNGYLIFELQHILR